MSKKSIKSRFRMIYGVNSDKKCGNCINCVKISVNNKHYYKCKIMGISNSTATDIRLKDYACSEFKSRIWGGINVN